MARIYLTVPKHLRTLHFGAEALARLEGLGEVITNPQDRGPTTAEAIAAAGACDFILCDRLTAGSAELFAALPKLKAFLRRSVDMHGVDIEAASKLGILVTHAVPGFVAAVTELMVAQMVNLARKVPEQVMAYRDGAIPKLGMGVQVSGKVAGIIGMGRIARRLAAILQAMEIRILAHDLYVEDWPEGVEPTTLDGLLGEADFVILLAVRSDETENIMNAETFARMKPSAYFVNFSRGGLVDEDALYEVLTSGGIAGAALDVGRETGGEEAGDVVPVRLGALPNVVATAHTAAMVPDAMLTQSMTSVEQLADIIAGREPAYALNTERASRLKLAPRAGGNP
ncbi:MAG TPA: NAD(P)-dependent oxidoreductase [Rhodospirillales bacterium]|jgi:D-3-phosphoglycerate dehydrogenase|nr:NAD(P)-dependent oxidoreductase [Rhodospirillales bacterium]